MMFQWEDKDSDFIHGEAAATDKTKFKHNKVYEHRPCVSTTSDRAMARAWNVEDMFSSPAFLKTIQLCFIANHKNYHKH